MPNNLLVVHEHSPRSRSDLNERSHLEPSPGPQQGALLRVQSLGKPRRAGSKNAQGLTEMQSKKLGKVIQDTQTALISNNSYNLSNAAAPNLDNIEIQMIETVNSKSCSKLGGKFISPGPKAFNTNSNLHSAQDSEFSNQS